MRQLSLFATTVLLLTLVTSAQAFNFSDVVYIASSLSEKSYHPPEDDLPEALDQLDYDHYRNIRFKPDQALWHNADEPFELQLLHPGFLYKQPVRINIVDDGEVQRVHFNPDRFNYTGSGIDPESLKNSDLGYSGFRVHYPLNTPNYKDEVLVFQGASYFRALGKGQRYGLSARGLAIDTAAISGEEFPVFREFWIVKPDDDDARQLTIYALLDSPSATGAYRFILKPGNTTQMEVSAWLYLRQKVTKLGIAPLTSMFDFGENQPSKRLDYRPEVHDSDGLSIHNGNDEWIWRPLVNPSQILVTSFGLDNPKGFGLMQRDTDFQHYEDLEARYDLRPSAWIIPKGDWGKGRLELVQLPTPNETNDNIVSYWIPAQQPEPGKPLQMEYQINWQKPGTLPPLAHVLQTRRGWGYRSGDKEGLHFIVDFVGGELADLDSKPDVLLWSNSNGQILSQQLYPNPVTGGYRLAFTMKREQAKQAVELRAALRKGAQAVSETWSYILPPSSNE